MQQADMRIDALDDLAVELQHQAQHAVRRRMLRAEVDVEVADSAIHRGFAVITWPSRRRAARSQYLPTGDRKSKLRNSCTSFTGS
jgi:hypothetical protein